MPLSWNPWGSCKKGKATVHFSIVSLNLFRLAYKEYCNSVQLEISIISEKRDWEGLLLTTPSSCWTHPSAELWLCRAHGVLVDNLDCGVGFWNGIQTWRMIALGTRIYLVFSLNLSPTCRPRSHVTTKWCFPVYLYPVASCLSSVATTSCTTPTLPCGIPGTSLIHTTCLVQRG